MCRSHSVQSKGLDWVSLTMIKLTLLSRHQQICWWAFLFNKKFVQSWPVLVVAINGPSWQASESRQANKTPELFLPSFPLWSALTANSRSLPVREDGKSCFVLTLVLWYLLWFQKILRIRAWKLTQGKDKDTGPRTVLPERASSHWELLRSDWEFIYATGQWVN